VRDEAAVAKLEVPDMDKLRYVFDAVTSIRKALNGRVPLIGFSGSPWTLACYMVEGAGSDDYRLVKTMLYQRPDLMHKMLAVNADAVAAYLNAQIEAGAQAVMIFDSWGGVLADAAFKTFSLAYTARVLASSSASMKASRSRAWCSPRAAASGWKPWRSSIARCWGWTGRSTWPGARAGRRKRPAGQGAAGQPRPQRPVCQPGPD
jgi:uroporphyrinogen decarboxylase